MTSLDYVVRPLEPWLHPTVMRRPSPFSATLTETMGLLDKELWHLGVRKTWVLQLDVRADQIRKDGGVYANATPASPKLRVCAETVHGPMVWPCDRFHDWRANLRAIALSLEALRRVDRYGVTGTGEQYRGFAALPQREHQMTREQAAELIAHWAGNSYVAADLLREERWLTDAYRRAAKRAHPDMTGDNGDTMTRLNVARDLLMEGTR